MSDTWNGRLAGLLGTVFAALLLAPMGKGHAEPLVIVGSGNVARILDRAAPAYAQRRAGTTLVIENRPSSAGPPALLRGRAQLASLSRLMTPDELYAFEKEYGRTPERISIAIDALAVFVHEANPLREITLPQLDAIFSSTRACGEAEAITSWAQLNIRGEWAERSIGLYGHAPSAGTHGFFRAHALCGGHFGAAVIQQPGGRSIVHSVAESRFAMGYSARADRIDGVRALRIAVAAEGPFGSVEAADVYSGAYPLTRDLYLYWLDDPAKPAETDRVREFLRFMLGPEGQQAAEAVGFLGLSDHRLHEERARLE